MSAELKIVEGGTRVDPRFVVDLKGKSYPTWPGVLDAAHREGLRGIEVKILQHPCAENQHTAVCEAIVTMEDGRTFCEIGDASPANTKLTAALLRIAATRAKGRAMRDAMNVGQTLLEELGDDDSPQQPRQQPPAYQPKAAPRAVDTPAGAVDADTGEVLACEDRGCRQKLTPGQVTLSLKKFGRRLCLAHQKIAEAQGEAAPAEAATTDVSEERAQVESAVHGMLQELDDQGYPRASLGLPGDAPLFLWLITAPDGLYANLPLDKLTLGELKTRARLLKAAVERAREAAAA